MDPVAHDYGGDPAGHPASNIGDSDFGGFNIEVPVNRSSGRQFKALMRKNYLLKKRHPFSLCCEIMLPILFVLAMTGLKGSNDEVDAILPVKSYPVPTLSGLANQTAYPNALCYDHNPFLKCSCDYTKGPNAVVEEDGLDEYTSPGLHNTVEAVFSTSHSLYAYTSICNFLAIQAVDQASQGTTNATCTTTTFAVDFCPRLFDSIQQIEGMATLVGACGIEEPTEASTAEEAYSMIAEAVTLAENAGAGISVPAESMATACAVQYLALVPYPTSADATAWSNTEAMAVAFGSHLEENAPEIRIMEFESDNALEDWLKQGDYSQDVGINQIGIGVVFESASPSWSYAIRANFSKSYLDADNDIGYFDRNVPSTNDITDTLYRDATYDTTDDQGALSYPHAQSYLYSGVLSLQQEVDTFILSQETTSAGVFSRPRYRLSDFPSAAYEENEFWVNVGDMFAIVLVLVLLYPVSNVLKSLVTEKELKIKEGMLMMGLSPFIYTFSWIVTFTTTFFFLAIVMTIIGSGSIFENSDAGIVFLYFFLFFMALLAMCFFIAAFFSKARSASTYGCLVAFLTVFPYFAVANNDTSESSALGACVIPSTCFALGTLPFVDFEDSGQGVTFDTWTDTGNRNFSMSQVIGMLIVDIFIYSILAWYANEVVPSEWGTSHPWYFPFTKAYWRPSKVTATDADALQAELDMDEFRKSSDKGHVEAVHDGLRRQLRSKDCVAIRGLEKEFVTGEQRVMAVNGLDLTMYRGQITALLGHNGAGKTTTINMLTGMVPVTGGTAVVNGLDVRTQMKEIRRNLGMCPQHDILYPDLTVREHLTLFANFKGVAKKEVASEVDRMIKAVGLGEKRDRPTNGLSGGQKRKLSVAIAFIGGSKVIFLDEPTSGMDPHSRRFTWDVIRKQKEGRVIVLTTHFMDEADLLGDRIAIMSSGELRCCGSSLFLKSHYGVGYNLTIVKEVAQEEGEHYTSAFDGGNDGGRGDLIRALVKRHVPSAKSLSNVGAEISFQLPSKASSSFKSLLVDLDNRRADLGITSYGMSVTTLEEVFIRVAHGTETSEDRARLASIRQQRSYSSGLGASVSRQASFKSGYSELTSAVQDADIVSTEKAIRPVEVSEKERYWRHMKALLQKRSAIFRRDRKSMMFSMFAPALFLLVGLLILLAQLDYKQDKLFLDLADYNEGISPQNPTLFSSTCTSTTVTCEAQSFIDLLPSDMGILPVVVEDANVEIMSEELIRTDEAYKASRYGAFSFGEIDTSTGEYEVIVHSNYTALHAAPAYLAAAGTSLLRLVAGESSDASDIGIGVIMHPLPQTDYEEKITSDFNTFPTVIFIMLGLAFIPAGWVGFVVREREIRLKHQQVVSGVSLMAYWASTYLWDMIVYLFTPVLTTLLVLAFDVNAIVDDGGLPWLFLLLLVYGPACAGFSYCMSFGFNSHATAMTRVLFISWILGMLLPIAIFFLLFFKSTRSAGRNLKWVLRILPPFAVGDGILSLSFRTALAFIYGENDNPSPGDMRVAGGAVIYLVVEAVVFYFTTMLFEHTFGGTATFGSFGTTKALKSRLAGLQDPGSVFDSDLRDELNPLVEDIDVVQERERVMANKGEKDVISVDGLKKAFPGGGKDIKVAVRNMWLGIPKGECFGLLGINGAGKTTTIAMLCGEQEPTMGTAALAGVNVASNPEAVHRLIGFCPQFDALSDLMTAREHLQLYAGIKGIPEDVVEAAVEQKIAEVDLGKYADKLAGGYSGGNKRKLSVAIAMLGSPEIVFLDEPSTGVDPVARRFMWDVISRIVTSNKECALVLTTHSMEECEALCTRIGVMVGGRLRCLGSAQHLKSRFGQGYQLEVTVNLPEEDAVARARSALLSSSNMAQAEIDQGAAEVATGEEDRAKLRGKESVEVALTRAYPALKDEISPTGRGSLLHQELLNHGEISAMDLASWCVTEYSCQGVLNFVAGFTGSTLQEKQGTKMRFDVPPQEGLSLGNIFGLLEDHRHELRISDYALGQTSLEQIFNFFASQQEEEMDTAPGMSQPFSIQRMNSQGSVLQAPTATEEEKTTAGTIV